MQTQVATKTNKQDEKQKNAISWRMNALIDAQITEYKDIKMVTGMNHKGKPMLVIWKGKQGEPYSNYYYDSEDSLLIAAMNAIKNADYRETIALEKKAEKASFVPVFDVGDIFVQSWGYDQTNINFYQVISKLSTHYAEIREISRLWTNDSQNLVTAEKNCFVENPQFLNSFTQRVKIGKYGISLRDGYSARKWDGKPVYQTSPYNYR